MNTKIDNVDCSIVIPTYNNESTIQRAIDCVTPTSICESKIKLYITDDGSVDETASIIDETLLLDNNVTSVHKHNNGVSSARNVGIDISYGDYIYFMDADDKMNITLLDKLIIKTKEKKIDLTVFDYLNSNNDDPESTFSGIDNERIYYRDELIKVLFPLVFTKSIKGFSMIWNKIYSSNVINNYKIRFDAKRTHGEDWMFNYHILDRIETLIKYNDIVYEYNIGEYIDYDKYNVNSYYGILSGYSYLRDFNSKYQLFRCDSKYYISFVSSYAQFILDYCKKTNSYGIDALLATDECKEISKFMIKLSNIKYKELQFCNRDKLFFLLCYLKMPIIAYEIRFGFNLKGL